MTNERLWPGRDAVGQRLQWQTTTEVDSWMTVVGITAPTVQHELDGAPAYDVYRSYLQVTPSGYSQQPLRPTFLPGGLFASIPQRHCLQIDVRGVKTSVETAVAERRA